MGEYMGLQFLASLAAQTLLRNLIMKTMLIVVLALCAMAVAEEETLQAEEQTLLLTVLTLMLSVTDMELFPMPDTLTPPAPSFPMPPAPSFPTPTPAPTLSLLLLPPTTTTSWTPPRSHLPTFPVLTLTFTDSPKKIIYFCAHSVLQKLL